jgi:hypothetical protein
MAEYLAEGGNPAKEDKEYAEKKFKEMSD